MCLWAGMACRGVWSALVRRKKYDIWVEDGPIKRHTVGVTEISGLEVDPCPGRSYDQVEAQTSVSTPTTPEVELATMDTPSSSRLMNFFSKRSSRNSALKRTKSVTKLERKRCAAEGPSVAASRLRTSRSHESLLQASPSVLSTVDFSQVHVQTPNLHGNIFPQECFQLTAENNKCKPSDVMQNTERDGQRQTPVNNPNSIRRTEKSLHIWIQELKGVAAKKRYFCELCLDKTFYDRTSSKVKGDMCFWGEHFEFNNLPPVSTITVNLYREADKKRRRDKTILLGSVHIPISSVNNQHLVEKWYPVFMEKGFSSKECPSVRIKSRFLHIDILPLHVYNDFLQYLKTDYKILCEMLEPAITVRTKEDISTSLVHIMQKENMAKSFLADIVMADLDKIDDHHLTFRGNSIATKATEAYMKLLGEKYLQDTLGDVVPAIISSQENCEVDPIKVTNNTALQKQQSNLITFVEMVWTKIANSASCFPVELREVFHECRQRLASHGKEDLSDNLISASIFLRFLCPAILSPSLFNITRECPQARAARNLTLVAKSIQTLANFTRFGGKESFMEFMNEFLEREWSTMKAFLKEISSPAPQDRPCHLEFDGEIDLGKELSILHGLLVECIPRITDKHLFDQLDKLQQVVDGLSAALSQPHAPFKHSTLPSFGDMNETKSHVCMLQQPTMSVDPVQRNFSLASSSTLPCTYQVGGNKQPASDLSTTDDYVLFSALERDSSYPLDGSNTVSLILRHPSGPDQSRLRMTQSYVYGQNSQPVTRNYHRHHNAKLHHECCHLGHTAKDWQRMSTPQRNNEDAHFPLCSNGICSEENHTVEQLCTNHESSDTPLCDAIRFSSHSEQMNLSSCLTCIPSNLTHQMTETSEEISCNHRPLAFSNPMYHFPSSSTPPCRHKRSGGSLSSDSDEEISIIGHLCLGNAESEPTLTTGRHFCCNSSSSSGSNSCDSSPPTGTRTAIKNKPFCCKFSSGTPIHYHHNRHSSSHWSHPGHSVQRSYTDPLVIRRHKLISVELEHSCVPSYIQCDQQPSIEAKGESTPSRPSVEEVEDLKRVMQRLQAQLQEAEEKLSKQEQTMEQVTVDWHARLEVEEDRIRRQQEEKDSQMRSIITRLITVEDDLKREQQEMQAMIADKQKLIESQERKIQSLDAANSHLMAMVTQMREQYELQGCNGIVPPLKMGMGEQSLLSKSSSC